MPLRSRGFRNGPPGKGTQSRIPNAAAPGCSPVALATTQPDDEAMSELPIPGPNLTASEQIRRWVEEPVAFWEECAREHGGVVLLDLGSLGPALLVSDPELVRAIFLLPRDAFECAPYNMHYRFVMGERSVLVSDGDAHRTQKPLLSSPLRRDALLPHGCTIRALADAMAATWPEGASFDPRPAFHEYTFQVVVHLLLGDLEGETARAFVADYRESVVPRIGGSWGPWQGFRRLHEPIRRRLGPEIAARRADPTRPGALTQLAAFGVEAGAPLDDAGIADHVYTLMVAGVDTTSLALTWALHWLSRAPEARARLVTELDGVAGQPPAGLMDLPWLHAVFLETLRMYPVVPTPTGRKLLRATTLAGREYPAGLTLIPCTYLVHRRPELYAEPAAFRPERFLAGRPESHHYFPFGGGVRTCVGEQLSRLDFSVALAALLTRWTFESVENGAVAPVRHGTMLAPSAAFRLMARSRGGRTSW